MSMRTNHTLHSMDVPRLVFVLPLHEFDAFDMLLVSLSLFLAIYIINTFTKQLEFDGDMCDIYPNRVVTSLSTA